MTRTSTSSGTYGVELKEGQLAGLKIGVVYCVSAWFRRGTTRGEIVLTTRHFKSGGFANILSTRVTPPDDGWYRLITPAGLTQEYNLDITFFTAVSTSAGSEYYVDDIRIWESPDLACDPACAP